MPASYPTSAKAFTTKVDGPGNTALAAHINDLQAEVTAVETDLIAGLPVSRGGTGATTHTSGSLLVGAGTSAVTSTLTPSVNNVVFPAVQVSSTNANTLDDYEEGTWTPDDQSGAALVFTSVEAQYVKIGQLVIAACTITFPATANGSAANIGGLPFAANASAIAIYGSTINFTSEATLFTMNVQPNTTRALPYTSAGAQLINSALSTDTIRFTAIYRATT